MGVVKLIKTVIDKRKLGTPTGFIPDRSTEVKGPYFITVANPKGGVAKTTTAVSLGGALVKRGQEVLMVDLDPQASLTLSLGKDPSRVRKAITEVLFNSATLVGISRETAIPGLDLVPSNSKMAIADQYLPTRKEYETILRRSTWDLNYDYVIFDCPTHIGAVTINALAAADLLIIPTQAEYYSVHSLKTLMNAIRQVRDQHNPGLIYRILITMLDRRNRIHREISKQIWTVFGESVFQSCIQIDTKLRESAIEGLPITYFRSKTRSAQEYNALAQEIIEYACIKESSKPNWN